MVERTKYVSLYAKDEGIIRMVKDALEPAGFIVDITRKELGLVPEPSLYSGRSGNTYLGSWNIARYCVAFGSK